MHLPCCMATLRYEYLIHLFGFGSCEQSQGSLEREPSGSSEGGVWTTMTSLTKQRVRLNMKLLGQFTSQPGTPLMKEDKPTYREQFVPPEMSMVSYFLIKVSLMTKHCKFESVCQAHLQHCEK